MCATALSAVTTPLAGHLSDRFGRKRLYLIGIAAIGVYTFIYFALLNTAIPAVIFVAIILSFIPHDLAYGPQAALIAECFPARLRYSGSSLGFHLASIIAGGPAAADRDGAPRLDRIGVFGRAVCPVELCHQHRCDDPTAGLHQPRHLGRTGLWAGRECCSSRGLVRRLNRL